MEPRKIKNGEMRPAWKLTVGAVQYRIPNPDFADSSNTVLKMAQKRALVAACLVVTNASAFFTQDVEDMPFAESIDVAVVREPEPKTEPEPKPQRNTPAQQKDFAQQRIKEEKAKAKAKDPEPIPDKKEADDALPGGAQGANGAVLANGEYELPDYGDGDPRMEIRAFINKELAKAGATVGTRSDYVINRLKKQMDEHEKGKFEIMLAESRKPAGGPAKHLVQDCHFWPFVEACWLWMSEQVKEDPPNG
jgi:hypothetical protein